MQLRDNARNYVIRMADDYAKLSAQFRLFCEAAKRLPTNRGLETAVVTDSDDTLNVRLSGASISLRMCVQPGERGRLEGKVYVHRLSHSLDGKAEPIGGFSFDIRGTTNVEDTHGIGNYDLDALAEDLVLHFIDEAVRRPVRTGVADISA